VTEALLSERFAVLTLTDGGILIDLSTGDYTRLNVTAAIVCDVLASSTTGTSTATRVAERLRISQTNATQAIESVTSALKTLPPRRKLAGDFRFEPASEGTGYVLLSGGVPRLWTSEDGLRLRVVHPGPMGVAELYEYVRSIAPKLLFLQGESVLHAAGCVTSGRLRAFCGESGAGKTTTARAFRAAGGRLISEDLLVLGSAAPLAIYAGGEKSVHGWARETAKILQAAPETELPTSTLRGALTGEQLAVREIWVIDAARRRPADGLSPRALGATDAAVAVMSSLFLGAASASGWRRFLALAGSIATSVATFEAPMPDGLDRLGAAVKAYTENSAS
jgi:hypothetical protein